MASSPTFFVTPVGLLISPKPRSATSAGTLSRLREPQVPPVLATSAIRSHKQRLIA
jgi:hypothetical protein